MECNSCNNGPAIVGGAGHLGARIALELRERGCEVTVIDHVLSASHKALEQAGCRLIAGDIKDDPILEEAGIRSASCFIAATGDDCSNLEAAISARQMNESATVIVRLFDQGLAQRIEGVFNIHALSASFLASPAFVSAATDDSILAMFHIDGSCLSLFDGSYNCSHSASSHSIYIEKDGANLRTCSADEKPSASCLRVEMKRHKTPRVRRKKAQTISQKLRSALSLIKPSTLTRKAVDIWSHATSISRCLMLSFLAVGLLSVFMFSFVGNMSPLDSLYFVVTTMTTVGYGDFNLQNAPVGLKIYGIIMMLSGAALLATIYAIIAEHVLTARVEYLLGRREVDMREHTVVVGLGKVGYRVAHDLKMLGVDVVAIEANEDSDNVSSARILFPVIIGDGSRESVLQKSGIARANTVLALTDDSMLNLSVALHARESNPAIKAIVRTYDFELAEKFSKFDLDEVLSTSAIAYPAFVDAAVYPNVQGSFRYINDDILVAKCIIEPDSPFINKTVDQIGKELGMAIILVTEPKGSKYDLASPNTALQNGQKSIVLLTRDKIYLLNGSGPDKIKESNA